MKNKTQVINILMFICIFFIVAGCYIAFQNYLEPSESGIPSEINNSLTPLVADNQSMPTSTRIPTLVLDNPTPVPTLTFDQQQHILLNVLDENCALPCYFGITPGITTLDEIIDIASNYGGILIEDNSVKIQGSYLQRYRLELNFNIGRVTYESLKQNLIVYLFEGTVVYINVHLVNRDLPLFYEYWSRYSAQTLIPQLGMPETVHIYKALDGFDFIGWTLTWKDMSIIVDYGDNKIDGMFCPQFESGYSRELLLKLSAPGTWQQFPGFFSDVLDLDFHTRDKTLVQNVLGIDAQQFLDQILSDEDICFKTPKE